MKVCKNCGEINPSDSLYCCSCGTTGFVFQEEVVCPHCGAINDKSFINCINCGNLLNSETVVDLTNGTQEPFAQDPSTLTNTAYGGVPLASTETAKCPTCGAVVPLTAIFCNKCGTSVANLHVHRVVTRKVCPHCGRPNPSQAAFCSYCFSSLANAKTSDMQLVHECQNLGDITVRQSYLEDSNGKNIVCPNCGSLNHPNEQFCVHCGLKLQIEAPKKYCPNCGEENPADSSFCQKCRWSFDGTEPDLIDKWVCSTCQHTNDKEDLFCSHCGTAKK